MKKQLATVVMISYILVIIFAIINIASDYIPRLSNLGGIFYFATIITLFIASVLSIIHHRLKKRDTNINSK